MTQTIITRYNNIDVNAIPASLEVGELAVNLLDKSVFSNNGSSIIKLYTDQNKYFNSDGIANNALHFNGKDLNEVLSSIVVKVGDATYSSINGEVSLPSYLPTSGGVLTGSLSVPNLTITSQDLLAHLAFSRQASNYITCPTNGTLGIIVNGQSILAANAEIVITDGIIYPGTTNATQLGYGDKRWSNISSINGDFSGDLTSNTFKTSSVLACGGRLRITSSNSANSFGFLKSTAYTTSLNRAVLDIGSNYGGTSDIASEAVDVVAMSMYRGAVGIGRAFSYDELYANRSNSVMLSVDGNIISTGEQTAGSDIRYKEIIEDIKLPIKAIANAPIFRFKWRDRDDNDIHIGTSAQYWEKYTPELVKVNKVTDFKHLNYSALGFVIGVQLSRELISLKKELKTLKNKLKKYEL